MTLPRSRAVNYALYQTGWLTCILGAACGWPVTGALIAAALIGAHLAWTTERAVELRLLLLALGLGVIVEAYQVRSGTYARFTSGAIVAWMSPPWLLLMWAQFATTFRSSLHAVMLVPRRAALFGLVGGPIAFLAGERLGAVTLARPLGPGLVRLSVTWGVALAICAVVARAAVSPYSAAPTPPR